MHVSNVSTTALQAAPVPRSGGDPDGGLDRARELAARQPTVDTVHLSSQAQQSLAEGIAGDPDHGADGK